MDTTRLSETLAELEQLDPADAPDLAERIAAALADLLEEDEPPEERPV